MNLSQSILKLVKENDGNDKYADGDCDEQSGEYTSYRADAGLIA